MEHFGRWCHCVIHKTANQILILAPIIPRCAKDLGIVERSNRFWVVEWLLLDYYFGSCETNDSNFCGWLERIIRNLEGYDEWHALDQGSLRRSVFFSVHPSPSLTEISFFYNFLLLPLFCCNCFSHTRVQICYEMIWKKKCWFLLPLKGLFRLLVPKDISAIDNTT